MSMNIDELEAESGDLLPGREALSRLRFSFTKTVTKHINVANVDATNLSAAVNIDSPEATAASEAVQSISVVQH